MTDHAWTVIGYSMLIAAVLCLVAMVGVPQMTYSDEVKLELVKTVREVGMLAAGFAFGAGAAKVKA